MVEEGIHDWGCYLTLPASINFLEQKREDDHLFDRH